MKSVARSLCVVMTVILTLSMIVMLVSCNDDTLMNWDNYLPTVDEYPLEVESVPQFEKRDLPNVKEVNDDYFQRYGLWIISDGEYCYGYLPLFDVRFGEGEQFTKITPRYIYYSDYFFFEATKSDSTTLYDIEGNKIVSGYYIRVDNYIQTRKVNGIPTKTATIYVQTNPEDETNCFYVALNENGTLAHDLIDANYSSSTPTTKLLLDWVESEPADTIDYSLQVDKFANSITVKDYGQIEESHYKYEFYRNDTLLSTLDIHRAPYTFYNLFYLDGKVFFCTSSTPYEAGNKYNYVNSAGERYYRQLHSFDIATGKLTDISTNYVIVGEIKLMFNRAKKVYDIAKVNAIPKINGVANANDSECTYMIDANGKVVFSKQNAPYGIPYVKIGSNYYTTTRCIVNSKLQLVADLGDATFARLLSNKIALHYHDKIGAVDFNGIVKMDFTPCTLRMAAIYGDYCAIQDDDGNEYIMDFSKGVVRNMADLFNTNTSDLIFGYGAMVGVKRSYGTDWYTIDGKKVINSAVNANLNIEYITLLNRKFGWLVVEVNTANGTKTQYYKISY